MKYRILTNGKQFRPQYKVWLFPIWLNAAPYGTPVSYNRLIEARAVIKTLLARGIKVKAGKWRVIKYEC